MAAYVYLPYERSYGALKITIFDIITMYLLKHESRFT